MIDYRFIFTCVIQYVISFKNNIKNPNNYSNRGDISIILHTSLDINIIKDKNYGKIVGCYISACTTVMLCALV